MTSSPQSEDTPRSLAFTVMEGMFEGFATGNDDIVDQLCAPDMIEHQFGLAGTGTEATQHVKAAMRQVHAATPDITFTYITNVTSSNPQVVRVEWAFSKEWSAVALREENGLFGLDFFYKRRFK